MIARTCARCAHAEPRYRTAGPYTWCKRFHCVPTEACIDWRAKRGAIAAAIAFYRRAAQ